MLATTYWNGQEWEVDFEELAPGIFVYHNAIPAEWDVINRIEQGLAKPGTRFAWKQAGLNFGHTDETHRKCKDFKIKDNGTLAPRDEYSEDFYVMYQQVIDSVKKCMSHYNPLNYLGAINYFECINIVRYGAGEFFKIHTDDGEPYRCTVSCVGYPNDNYEGGELYFPKFNVKYKPKAGDFVLSPSTYVYAHSSEPVTDDGIKYSFVLMTDRNEFAHRNDSPTYHPVDFREAHGVGTN